METLLANTDVAVVRLQALGEETRLRVVQLLVQGERCVCELQAELGASQSRLSFHLRRLKDAGLVQDRKEGRWVHYSLIPGVLQELGAWVQEIPQHPYPTPSRAQVCCP